MNKKILGNRYEIINKIGEGGMARVYKAKDQLLNRHVAIKVLKSELHDDSEFVMKFDKEAKAAASLSHPNIVNVYDVGEDEETKFIVMELLEGTTLKDIILSHPGFLDNNEIIDIIYQIASALEHAHQNNIIHRDIKPENIVIDHTNSVKVADFGIARAVTTSTIVNTKRVLGSVHYSSPEQARGSVVDYRTDIYSLGILAYELATKRLPFNGDSEISIALKHIKGQVLPPSEINKDISPGLEKIILKSIKKNPDERYSDATALLSDLDKAMRRLDDEIVINHLDVDSGETKYLPDLEDGDFMSKPIKKKRKNNHKKPSVFSIMVVILVALILTLGVFTIMSLDDIAKRLDNEVVVVPDVVGMEAKAGSRKLTEIGLSVDATRRKKSETVPAGYIISQSHEPGDNLKKDYTVEIVISEGNDLIVVPNVINDDFSDGKIEIENSDLVLGEIVYEYSELPMDTIIDQEPLAGQEVPANSKVRIIVSQGPEEAIVLLPSLEGLTLAQAEDRLDRINVNIGNITYQESTEFEEGVIIDQSIESGEEVTEESFVDIVISQNSEEAEETPTEEESFEKVFIIPLNFNEEKMVVKVEKISAGVSEIVYEKEHLMSEGSVRVIVSGKGEALIKFYYGDTMISQQNVVFE